MRAGTSKVLERGAESCATDPAVIAEHRDSVGHLRSLGFAPLLEALADRSIYTLSGKVVLARLARKLGISQDRCQMLLASARQVAST